VPGTAPPFGFDAERLSLDFLSTLSNRGSDAAVERLPDAESLAAWLEAAGLGPLAGRVTGRDLELARRLRDATFALVDAAMSRGPAAASAVDLVNRAAEPTLPAVRLVREPQGVSAARPPVAARQALGAVARDAIDLLAGEAASHLRECEAEDCTGLYLDASHGRRRRWCSSARCGNRARVSAHRARARRDG
jgi:predicted RNA-binding Zn ribbon-like protein